MLKFTVIDTGYSGNALRIAKSITVTAANPTEAALQASDHQGTVAAVPFGTSGTTFEVTNTLTTCNIGAGECPFHCLVVQH